VFSIPLDLHIAEACSPCVVNEALCQSHLELCGTLPHASTNSCNCQTCNPNSPRNVCYIKDYLIFAQLLSRLASEMAAATRGNIESEFDVICSEKEVGTKLNKLDAVQIEQKEYKDEDGKLMRRPRPAASAPIADLKREVLAARQAELQKLKDILSELKAGNDELEAKADTMHDQAAKIQAKMDESTQMMNGAADAAEALSGSKET